MPITSMDYGGRQCALRHKGDGTPVEEGDRVADHHGEEWFVDGGSAPRHEASTGRVFVHQLVEGAEIHMGYFPNVFELEWIVI